MHPSLITSFPKSHTSSWYILVPLFNKWFHFCNGLKSFSVAFYWLDILNCFGCLMYTIRGIVEIFKVVFDLIRIEEGCEFISAVTSCLSSIRGCYSWIGIFVFETCKRRNGASDLWNKSLVSYACGSCKDRNCSPVAHFAS